MRFYRVATRNMESGSIGFQWTTTKDAAEKIKRDFVTTSEKAAHEGPQAEIEPIDVIPTKGGILRALNRYASHADND